MERIINVLSFWMGFISLFIIASISGGVAEKACMDVSKASACELVWVPVEEEKP